MHLVLDHLTLPLWLIPDEPLDDVQLLEFCETNDPTSVQGTGPVLSFELMMNWIWG